MRNAEDFLGYHELIEKGIYQGVEIFYPYNVSKEQAEFYTTSISKLKNKFPNLEMVMHLPHGKQNSLTDEYLENSYNLMIDAIEYADRFGIKKLTLHLGSVKAEKERSLYIVEISNVLRKLCEYSSKYGMFLMIENMPGTNELGVGVDELLEIIQRTNCENLKFILDTGHANVANVSIPELIYTLKDYLFHLHFNDNDGVKDQHKRMHQGNINFKEMFIALDKIGYNELHCMEVIFHNYNELYEFSSDLDIYKKRAV